MTADSSTVASDASPAWSRVTTRYHLNDPFPIDPYLVWAELSDWEGFGGERPALVRVLIQLAAQPDTTDPGWQAIADMVNSNPLNYPDLKGPSSRFATANVRIDELDTLTQAVRRKLLVRFQLGLARGGVRDEHGFEPFPRAPLPTRLQQAAQAAAATVAALDAARADAAADGDAKDPNIFHTMGVIDDGCCLAHECFRRNNRSDFLLVWDQNPQEKPEPPWTRYEGVSYGEELSYQQIDAVLNTYPTLGELAERELYVEGLNRPGWGDFGRTHGAGVLHIAWNTRLPEDWGRILLMFVQLPTDTVADTSGGSLGVYIIDGARYIAQRTRLVAEFLDKIYKCNINISLGSIAGPHDGSTITELALAELGEDEGMQIALAAGNVANKLVHAVRTVTMSRPGRFFVMVPPDNPRESYVEIWLPTNDGAVHAEDFTIEVVAPNGARSPAMEVGQAASLLSGKRTLASLVFARRMAQGLNGTMVLLAIRSITALDESGGDGPYGPWSIEVTTTLDFDVKVHAWVERNDILTGGRLPQQTRFTDDGSGYVNDQYTLSSVANGDNVVVVGAFRSRQKAVSDYSSNGPTLNGAGRHGPDFYGSADRSVFFPGRMLAGFWSGSTARMSGTSAAAAHVTRWMARGCPPDQEREVRTTAGRRVKGIAPQTAMTTNRLVNGGPYGKSMQTFGTMAIGPFSRYRNGCRSFGAGLALDEPRRSPDAGPLLAKRVADKLD